MFSLNDFKNYCACGTYRLAENRRTFALGGFFVVTSVTSLPAISLERMHATFRLIKHRLINRWIFGAAVEAVWCTSSLLMLVDLLDYTRFFNALFSLLYLVFSLSLFLIRPSLLKCTNMYYITNLVNSCLVYNNNNNNIYLYPNFLHWFSF